jgi:hypothetical protein
LQPPFFSMVEWHFVHSFVLAEIQLLVSESSLHFLSQRLTMGQQHGRWSPSSWQPKQKMWPHAHWTVGMVMSSERGATAQETANSQFGAGHQRILGLSST